MPAQTGYHLDWSRSFPKYWVSQHSAVHCSKNLLPSPDLNQISRKLTRAIGRATITPLGNRILATVSGRHRVIGASLD